MWIAKTVSINLKNLILHFSCCRKLDLSPTQTKTEFNPGAYNGSVPQRELRKILPSPLTNGQAGPTSTRHSKHSVSAMPKPEQSSSVGLLKTATPHSMFKSALTYSQPRLHIPESEKVILADNPLYWDVSQVLDFIRQTDCANLADKLADQVRVSSLHTQTLPTPASGAWHVSDWYSGSKIRFH